MRNIAFLLVALGSLPVAGQAWDVRVEMPFAEGQRLPGTLIQGTDQLIDGDLNLGKGVILSVNHRLLRLNPVVRLDWCLEAMQVKTGGHVQVGDATYDRRLKQTGFGVGLNAQFWVPFTGAAAELGLIQRFHDYRFAVGDSTQNHQISRTWLRVGARWRLPMPVAAPYLAASYQQPLAKSHPAHRSSAPDLASYLAAQGKGQEFQRLWTFGVGLQF